MSISVATAASAVVDVVFPISGLCVPTDHGFQLYAGVSTVVPELHQRADYGIHPIAGHLLPGRQLALTRTSRLAFRVPVEMVPVLLRLSGKQVRVGGQRIVVGAPAVHALQPSATLWSRLVVIKGAMEPEAFLAALRRQLMALGIQADAQLAEKRGRVRFEGRTLGDAGPMRRTLRIRDREVVGYSVAVEGLDSAASVFLQGCGLGGRRRFGCGVLLPGRTPRP